MSRKKRRSHRSAKVDPNVLSKLDALTGRASPEERTQALVERVRMIQSLFNGRPAPFRELILGLWRNPSSRNLILGNLATMIAAIVLEWPLFWLVWPYWIQSVMIGWYARKRIQHAERSNTSSSLRSWQEAYQIWLPHRDARADAINSTIIAHAFTGIYGFVHLVYLIFLTVQYPVDGLQNASALLICGISFAFSQRATFARQLSADRHNPPTVDVLFKGPCQRITPMHLMIILGGVAMTASQDRAPLHLLLLFTALKTAADITMDNIDQCQLHQAETPPPQAGT